MKDLINPKLITVVLQSEEELEYFKIRASKLIGVEFPIEYLQQGMVRGFLDLNGELVGGYALITEGPFRTIRSLPDGTEVPFDEKELFEVTALWMDNSVKRARLRAKFWYQFARDIFSMNNKKYYVYAYGLYNKKLQKIYSKARPHILYQGPVKALEGNTDIEVESVEVAKVSTMKLMPFLTIPSMTKRIAFKHNRIIKYLRTNLNRIGV